MHDKVTPYVLQYQLKRNLRPFTREEILQLQTGRSGVYVLWRKTGTEGRNECPLRRRIHNLCAEAVVTASLKRTE